MCSTSNWYNRMPYMVALFAMKTENNARSRLNDCIQDCMQT